MKVPKYIFEAIKLRAIFAQRYSHYDHIVSDYIDKNNIDCEYIHGHVETIINPVFAARETFEAIKEAVPVI